MGRLGGIVPGRAFFWVWEVFISYLVLRNVEILKGKCGIMRIGSVIIPMHGWLRLHRQ
ncbi:hypothetical protein [Vulcanisaeta distributa]|uniref:Uncharacterized protein n=1 Tax=Vulcanisaeta distributa (strain DSM 14429 / JCM 11212 / NBRC 100878 / IC-017) TaxID=572478 RepID=E1QT29_VULDI|nr:hypothetical protein [Vulcanisaeta distributa]ADN49621.1 hypothetical protein Vdis_0208 [Vulcanisaeta distributa DSM 14429]